ncbi:MAG TPA: hypothetical protein VGD79_05365 [Thermoanaerobaculia bacterium]|jgi:hypothetical protein
MAASNDDAVPILAEPRPGYTDDDVTAALTSCGATNVEILAPGFISARAPARALSGLAEVAELQRKSKKRLRRR